MAKNHPGFNAMIAARGGKGIGPTGAKAPSPKAPMAKAPMPPKGGAISNGGLPGMPGGLRGC